jgi:hypothetical protein
MQRSKKDIYSITSSAAYELGAVPTPMTPADFKKFIAEEVQKLEVVRAAHLKAADPALRA